MRQSLFIVAVTLLFSLAVQANNSGNSRAEAIELKDVETLNDNINKYNGKYVKVSGEVEDRIDSRAVLVESGGIIDDEVIVISNSNIRGAAISSLKDDDKITVVGRVHLKPLSDMRREYSWELAPESEEEFKNVKAYVVAEEVSVVK